MTIAKSPGGALVNRTTNILHCPVLGIHSTGYEAALQAEKDEVERERVRLWYVAATRARNLLVLPKLDVKLAGSAWISAAGFPLEEMPSIDVPTSRSLASVRPPGTLNSEAREQFAVEASRIVAQQQHISWLSPSRKEHADSTAADVDPIDLWIGNEEGHTFNLEFSPTVQGSRARGIILHKLMEEAINRQIRDTVPAITNRAAELIRSLGFQAILDVCTPLSPEEMANCVVRTLALPVIVDLRPRLLAEISIFGIHKSISDSQATFGIVDAIAVGDQGTPQVIIDWKSDLDPDQRTQRHYEAQMQAYLEATGTPRGLILLLTSQRHIEVANTRDKIGTKFREYRQARQTIRPIQNDKA